MNNSSLKDQITAHYATLDTSGKMLFLAKVAEWLTLDGRATLRPTPESESERMRTVLEVLHRVVAQLHGMLAAQERYPDNVFPDVLAEQLERLKFGDAAIRRLLT